MVAKEKPSSSEKSLPETITIVDVDSDSENISDRYLVMSIHDESGGRARNVFTGTRIV